MKSQRKIVVFALTLSLCVITRIALGTMQKCWQNWRGQIVACWSR